MPCSPRHPLRHVFLAAASSLALFAGTQPALAQTSEQQTVTIETQPLAQALNELGARYDVTIVAADDVTSGQIGNAVAGDLTIEEALERLLSGTGLTAQRLSSRSYVIVVTETDDAISVYGLRKVTDRLDVTSSLSITTGEEIERLPVADLDDVIQRVPGVTSNNGTFNVRGVDQRGPSGGNGETLTVYLDDSPLSLNNLNVGPTGIWDLEQVEVFLGPQSTNLGRNTLAGAIYIRTGDPSYDWSGKARLEVGNQGQLWGAAAIGGGLIDDVLAFRLAADYRETDGFRTNTFLDINSDRTQLWNTRFKLRFDPSTDFSVITTTSYSENRIGFGGNLSSTNFVDGGPILPPSEVRREFENDLDSFAEGSTFLQSVNMNWAISDTLNLQSITTYQESTQSRSSDLDNSAEPASVLLTDIDDSAFTQELRLGLDFDGFEGIVGFYFADIDSASAQTLLSQANTLPLPGFSFLPDALILDRVIRPIQETRNYAIFADADIALTDTLDLLVGARYDFENNDNTSDQTIAVNFIPPGFEAAFAPFLGTNSEQFDATYEAFLPKLGLRWAVADNVRLGFVVQRAYRAGGSQTNQADGSQVEFDPEFLWNYEFSARASLLGGDLELGTNIYYSDWTDQQVVQPLPPPLQNFGITVNAGQSELYGIESSASYKLTSEFTIYGSAAYTVANFVDFNNGFFNPGAAIGGENIPNFNGNRFPNAPRFTFNAGMSYQGNNGLSANLDVNHEGSAFTSAANLDTLTRPSRTLVNARVGYALSENFQISAVAQNLLDESYFTFVNGTIVGLGDPFTWAIRLDAQF